MLHVNRKLIAVCLRVFFSHKCEYTHESPSAWNRWRCKNEGGVARCGGIHMQGEGESGSMREKGQARVIIAHTNEKLITLTADCA